MGAVVVTVGEERCREDDAGQAAHEDVQPSSVSILVDDTPVARGFMRDRPLLLILDEPTAASDAETEQGFLRIL